MANGEKPRSRTSSHIGELARRATLVLVADHRRREPGADGLGGMDFSGGDPGLKISNWAWIGAGVGRLSGIKKPLEVVDERELWS